MPKFRILIATVTSLALLSACGAEKPAEETRTMADEIKEKAAAKELPGPAVETAAPIETALVNNDGATQQIADMAGENGTVLVFFRSADWCGYCKAQLKALQGITDQVASKGYTLVAISYDTPEIQKEFAQKEALTFAMLSDTDSKMIDAFGIRDRKGRDSKYDGYPYASIYVLDKDNVIKARDVSLDYKVRPTNEMVLEMIGSVG